MNLRDFYRKYLDQDKFPNLRKFVASKMALFGSTYLWTIFFWNGLHEISLVLIDQFWQTNTWKMDLGLPALQIK